MTEKIVYNVDRNINNKGGCMFAKRDYDKISFKGVGLAFIVLGMLICGFAFAAWILRFFGFDSVCALPFFKVMGAIMIIGFGYIILEIELLRKK